MSPHDHLHNDEQELVRYLNDDLGEYFNLAVAYDDSDIRTLYLSPTAETTVTKSDIHSNDLHTLVADLRDEGISQNKLQSAILGEYRCSLYLYSEWLLLHYQESDEGVIIGVDAQSASNLRRFLDDLSPVVSAVVHA
ncbi:hypothetical protein [Halobellus sp. Atlit-38R]|uniref:hypothetical protein n=1 Tax=Halobellus sp. Atlit-38R TaxID=2282131 RepID=UPI0011C3CFDA|nr:hypothetical protein [Halobellus sp. Atlit-38R]